MLKKPTINIVSTLKHYLAKGHRVTSARMPVIPLATRSQHVDFAYDLVVRPHRSYRPSGGLPRGKPRTRHMWICLKLSGARGVENGGVMAPM